MKTKLEQIRDLLSGNLARDARDTLRADLESPDSSASQFVEGLRLASAGWAESRGSRLRAWAPVGSLPWGARGIGWRWFQRAATVLLFLLPVGTAAYAMLQLRTSRVHEGILEAAVAELQEQTTALSAELSRSREREPSSDEAALAAWGTQLARSVVTASVDKNSLRPLVVRSLATSLNDKNPGVRLEAARCLGQLGPAVLSTLPTIRERLAVEPDPEVQRALSHSANSIEQGK